MHEVYIYSLDGQQKEFFINQSDEFLSHWVKAFARLPKRGEG